MSNVHDRYNHRITNNWKGKTYDENGNEVTGDDPIMRDGHRLTVPLMLMDANGQANAARELLADKAAQVRADLDRKVYAAHGMTVPAGSVAVFDASRYLPVGQRSGSLLLADDVANAKQAMAADYNARISSAWKNPPGYRGD